MVAGCCSSVHTVLSNEDLLIEILLRLPAISLHLFKSVSKRWLSLITSPTFAFLHCSQNPKIDPPSGFFVRHPLTDDKYDFVRLDNRIPASAYRFRTTFKFGSNTSVQIVHSCNGLVLCKSLCSAEYYIYNPSSNRFKILPPRHSRDSKFSCIFSHMKLAFDPTKSPHYKIVYAQNYGGWFFQIQAYSSETGIWRAFRDQFPLYCFEGFSKGIYWNDAIHWTSYLRNGSHYKLDIVNEVPVLRKVQLPIVMCGDEKVVSDHKLFESCGSLLLLSRDDYDSRRLNIYEMRNGYSEWSLKYLVDLDDIRIGDPTRRICNCVWFIILGDKEEDTCMVFENDEMNLLLYKIVSKSTRELYELQLCISEDSFMFTASFAGL